MAKIEDLEKADVTIVYAAGGNVFDALAKRSKNMIIFCRHKSGPVYLWYEIISPRYLRQHTDALKVQGIDDGDVVVDNQDEILWRLRALCGLQNTLGTKILCHRRPRRLGSARRASCRTSSGRSGSSTCRPSPTTSWAS